MVNRKIVEIDEERCNGCGVCIPKCAEGALKIVGGKARLVSDVYCDGLGACLGQCPQDAIRVIEREAPAFDEEATRRYLEAEGRAVAHTSDRKSKLRNWPVQLNLVNPAAKFFDGAHLLIMADCVPVAHPDYQASLLGGKIVLIGCPKFDDSEAYLRKLTEIFRLHEIRGVTVIHMEVPCCSGLQGLVTNAIRASGKMIPVTRQVLSVEGEIIR